MFLRFFHALLLLAAALAADAASAADRTTTGAPRPRLVFGPIEDLPPELAAFAARAVDEQFDDPGDRSAARRAAGAGAGAAQVSRPGGRDILFLTWPTLGNCGSDIAAYAPALGPDPIGWACGVTAWTEERAGAAWPDILFASGSLAAMRFVFAGGQYAREGPGATLAPVDPALSLATAGGPALLQDLILTDDYGRLFAIPEVRDRLSRGFGDEFLTFLAHFEEVSPLMTYDGYLYGTATVRHFRGILQAFVTVALDGDDVQAGLAVRDRDALTFTLVTGAADVAALPSRFREWVEEIEGDWMSFPSERRVMIWAAGRPCADGLAPTVACDR